MSNYNIEMIKNLSITRNLLVSKNINNINAKKIEELNKKINLLKAQGNSTIPTITTATKKTSPTNPTLTKKTLPIKSDKIAPCDFSYNFSEDKIPIATCDTKNCITPKTRRELAPCGNNYIHRGLAPPVYYKDGVKNTNLDWSIANQTLKKILSLACTTLDKKITLLEKWDEKEKANFIKFFGVNDNITKDIVLKRARLVRQYIGAFKLNQFIYAYPDGDSSAYVCDSALKEVFITPRFSSIKYDDGEIYIFTIKDRAMTIVHELVHLTADTIDDVKITVKLPTDKIFDGFSYDKEGKTLPEMFETIDGIDDGKHIVNGREVGEERYKPLTETAYELPYVLELANQYRRYRSGEDPSPFQPIFTTKDVKQKLKYINTIQQWRPINNADSYAFYYFN